MALLSGARVGPYEVTGLIGAGGMGEVYRARDTALGRDVAIKTLPPEVARDAARIARFRREAHLLASLNHHAIGAIYGLQEADGALFLVLELIEGVNLAERLDRGPIPTNEALEIARQIAEALEAAHEAGIIHRDLKPANIKLRPDGSVKVLDFGLGKAFDDGIRRDPHHENSPTLTYEGTEAGVILGTAAYMAPEQARGRVVNRRADIWAFGVVLYEMLAGRPLFAGQTVTDVLAAVVHTSPDWSALPVDTPVPIRRLLRRCLEKDPRLRLPDIGAARLELTDVLAGASDEDSIESSAIPQSKRREPQRRWITGAAGAGGLIAGAALAFLYVSPRPPPEPLMRLTLQPPADLRLGAESPQISPDGRHVVVVGTRAGGVRMLWVRHVDALPFEHLEGSVGAHQPFWSPDSRSLAFVAEGALKRLDLAGGAAQSVCRVGTAEWVRAGAWNRDGLILFSRGPIGSGSRIFAVAATGGEPQPVMPLDEAHGETGHYYPRFLPDGRRFLFMVRSSDPGHAGVYVASLDSPVTKHRLRPDVTGALSVQDHLLFVRGNTLVAQRFDGGMQATGEAFPIAEDIERFGNFQAGLTSVAFSASASGVVAYLQNRDPNYRIAWVGRSGAELVTVGDPQPYRQMALSPDGKRLALEIPDTEGGADIWTLELERDVATRVTFERAADIDPVWSPDGAELAFTSERTGTATIFRKRLDAKAPESPLIESSTNNYPENWSKDGTTIVYVVATGTGTEIWTAPLTGNGQPELLIRNGFFNDEPQISPDERWLAYTSDESGDFEVYIAPFGRPGERVRVSPAGGGQPKWRADGREIFYLAASGKLMAVQVDTGADLQVGSPMALFDLGDFQPNHDSYAADRNGQRFLVMRPVDAATATPVHLLFNWEGSRP